MAKLDELADEFSTGKDARVFNEMMNLLEKSTILMPAEISGPITEEMKAAAAAGKPFPLAKGQRPNVKVLKLNSTGDFALPIFSSIEQIPSDKMTSLISVPFKAAVDMAKAEGSNARIIILNPFSKPVVLPESIIDMAKNRLDAAAGGGQQVELTEEQVHAILHTKMSREYLPARFFKDRENALSDIRIKKEKMIIEGYKSMYPTNLPCPYTDDDVSVMSMQIDDDLLITRIDFPDGHKQEGSPLRIYVVINAGTLYYYIIEKGPKGKPGNIAQMDENANHIIVSEAPDNGAEIETIISLVRPS